MEEAISRADKALYLAKENKKIVLNQS